MPIASLIDSVECWWFGQEFRWTSIQQFTRSVGLEVAGVALVGVDVDLELEAGVDTHQHLLQHHAARTANLQLHDGSGFHAVVRRVRRAHVHVAHRPNDPLLHFEETFRPHQHAPQGALDLAGNPVRQFEPQRDAVRVGQLDLIEAPAGSQDPQVRDHPAARSDQGDRLLGRELPLLVKPLVHGQWMALAEKRFDGLLGEMTVPGADIHHQRAGSGRTPGKRLAQALVDRLSHEVLYDRPMNCRRTLIHTYIDRSTSNAVILPKSTNLSNEFLHKLPKSINTLPGCSQKSVRSALRSTCRRWNSFPWTSWRRKWG